MEDEIRRRGFEFVAGIDEAGRGPLAGPVVAAAVVLPPHADLPGVRDSKQLSSSRREACLEAILACARCVGIGLVEAGEIDRINILQASLQAMVLAVKDLQHPPDYLLIDGPYALPLPVSQTGITRGDQQCLCIAAASVVAKVHRDRLMDDYHRIYPAYGFSRHKGYGTPEHLQALNRWGPCPIHRKSFRRVIDPVEEGASIP